jgi:hypothetical protein
MGMMAMDRWEKNARNRNRARDRKMPLLAYAGIADQVVPDWTPMAVQERVEAIVAGYQEAVTLLPRKRGSLHLEGFDT